MTIALLIGLPIVVTVLWMIGGQFAKQARRFGVPVIVGGVAVVQMLRNKEKKLREKVGLLLIFLWMFILSMGYGVDSVFMKIFKKEWIVRIVYGIIVALPFSIYVALSPSESKLLIPLSIVVMSGAFSVRAGSLGMIGEYDILIEDIVRGVGFGIMCDLVFIL